MLVKVFLNLTRFCQKQRSSIRLEESATWRHLITPSELNGEKLKFYFLFINLLCFIKNPNYGPIKWSLQVVQNPFVKPWREWPKQPLKHKGSSVISHVTTITLKVEAFFSPKGFQSPKTKEKKRKERQKIQKRALLLLYLSASLIFS